MTEGFQLFFFCVAIFMGTRCNFFVNGVRQISDNRLDPAQNNSYVNL